MTEGEIDYIWYLPTEPEEKPEEHFLYKVDENKYYKFEGKGLQSSKTYALILGYYSKSPQPSEVEVRIMNSTESKVFTRGTADYNTCLGSDTCMPIIFKTKNELELQVSVVGPDGNLPSRLFTASNDAQDLTNVIDLKSLSETSRLKFDNKLKRIPSSPVKLEKLAYYSNLHILDRFQNVTLQQSIGNFDLYGVPSVNEWYVDGELSNPIDTYTYNFWQRVPTKSRSTLSERASLISYTLHLTVTRLYNHLRAEMEKKANGSNSTLEQRLYQILQSNLLWMNTYLRPSTKYIDNLSNQEMDTILDSNLSESEEPERLETRAIFEDLKGVWSLNRHEASFVWSDVRLYLPYYKTEKPRLPQPKSWLVHVHALKDSIKRGIQSMLQKKDSGMDFEAQLFVSPDIVDQLASMTLVRVDLDEAILSAFQRVYVVTENNYDLYHTPPNWFGEMKVVPQAPLRKLKLNLEVLSMWIKRLKQSNSDMNESLSLQVKAIEVKPTMVGHACTTLWCSGEERPRFDCKPNCTDATSIKLSTVSYVSSNVKSDLQWSYWNFMRLTQSILLLLTRTNKVKELKIDLGTSSVAKHNGAFVVAMALTTVNSLIEWFDIKVCIVENVDVDKKSLEGWLNALSSPPENTTVESAIQTAIRQRRQRTNSSA